ncbi:hypothetical protein ACO0QE_001393 [Hanseniaspora vineae]
MSNYYTANYYLDMEDHEPQISASSGALSLNEKIPLDDNDEKFERPFSRNSTFNNPRLECGTMATSHLNFLSKGFDINYSPKTDKSTTSSNYNYSRAAFMSNSFSPSSTVTPFSEGSREMAITGEKNVDSASSTTYICPTLLDKRFLTEKGDFGSASSIGYVLSTVLEKPPSTNDCDVNSFSPAISGSLNLFKKKISTNNCKDTFALSATYVSLKLSKHPPPSENCNAGFASTTSNGSSKTLEKRSLIDKCRAGSTLSVGNVFSQLTTPASIENLSSSLVTPTNYVSSKFTKCSPFTEKCFTDTRLSSSSISQQSKTSSSTDKVNAEPVSPTIHVSSNMSNKRPSANNSNEINKRMCKKTINTEEILNLKHTKNPKTQLAARVGKISVVSMLSKRETVSLPKKKKKKVSNPAEDKQRRLRTVFTTQEQKIILEGILVFLRNGNKNIQEDLLESVLTRKVFIKVLTDISKHLENANTQPLNNQCKRSVSDIQKKLVDLRKAYFVSQMSDTDLENHAIWMSKTFNKAARKNNQEDDDDNGKKKKLKCKSVLQYYIGLEKRRDLVLQEAVVLPLLLALRKYWVKVEHSMRRTSFTTHWDYINNKEVTAGARTKKP